MNMSSFSENSTNSTNINNAIVYLPSNQIDEETKKLIEKMSHSQVLHLFSFKTPILIGKKIRKNVKSIVGISPTMVLLFHLLFVYLKM